MSMTSTYRKDHVPELDGLRAVAVGLVLWQHVPNGTLPLLLIRIQEALFGRPLGGPWPLLVDRFRDHVGAGYLGVDVFFVLSGFLITRILLVDKEKALPLGYFLLRRFLRIFPIYYLLLAVVWWVRPGPEIPWCALYASNFWFLANPMGSPLLHTWSLAVEEHFYIAWPPLIYLLSDRGCRRLIVFGLIPGAVLMAALTAWIWRDDFRFVQKVTQYGTMFRIASLSIGALIALGEASLRAQPARTRRRAVALAVIGYVVYVAGLRVDIDHAGAAAKGLSRMIGLGAVSAGLVLFLLAVTGSASWPARCMRSAVLRFVGRISYGLYLYHLPIYFSLGVIPGQQPPAAPSRAALALALSFAVATVSYLVIERPILRVASRFRAAS